MFESLDKVFTHRLLVCFVWSPCILSVQSSHVEASRLPCPAGRPALPAALPVPQVAQVHMRCNRNTPGGFP